MKKTCKECGCEFNVFPTKPDAEFCSICIETLVREQKARQAAAAAQNSKSLTASMRTNTKHREEERKHKAKLDQMGFRVVRRFTTPPVAEYTERLYTVPTKEIGRAHV